MIYRVSKHGIGWSCSYKVQVKNNHISNVYDLKSNTAVGSLQESTLKKISGKKAKWTGVIKIGVVSLKVSCTTLLKEHRIFIKWSLYDRKSNI